jgi:hypothetical protein
VRAASWQWATQGGDGQGTRVSEGCGQVPARRGESLELPSSNAATVRHEWRLTSPRVPPGLRGALPVGPFISPTLFPEGGSSYLLYVF